MQQAGRDETVFAVVPSLYPRQNLSWNARQRQIERFPSGHGAPARRNVTVADATFTLWRDAADLEMNP